MSIPHDVIKTANPDELFDVVDQEDRVIGRAPRREVHAKNLRHRATHVIVHDAYGNVFIQKRSRAKDTFPGCWDSSCSGHVDAGEDYLIAARRELGEELGCHDVKLPLRPVVKLPASAETGHEFIQIYLMGPYSGTFDLNPEEITEGRWISAADLERAMAESPDQFAGAIHHLWQHHRAALLAGIGVA